MDNKKCYIIIAVIVVITIILIVAYHKGWLNKILPTKWQMSTQHSGFVGAYGRTPGMEHCLTFPYPHKRWASFNRCVWV